MAIKRIIDTGLWSDPIIIDEFSGTEKYFWLYCLTNQHMTLCGIALVSKKTIAREMGIPFEDVEKCITNFIYKYKMIQYNEINNELFVINWYKYNWTTSLKVKSSLLKQINDIKTEEFKNNILNLINNINWSIK